MSLNKNIKILLLLIWIAAILFLMLASFTNLIFDENKETVYNITLMIDDDQRRQYDMLKKGMEKARQGTGIKLFYLNILDNTEETDIQSKLEEHLQSRDMVIVKCDSSPLLNSAVQKCTSRQNLISINAAEPSAATLCNIHIDEAERGRSLAERIGKDLGNDAALYVFGSAYEKLEQDVCASALAESGLSVTACLDRSDEEIRERLIQLSSSKENAAAVIMHTDTAKRIVQIQEDEGTDIPLYCFGYDPKILQYMDEDKIQAVNIISDYRLGYLSMYSAICFLEGKLNEDTLELESYTIGNDEMFLEEYEEILFAGN